MQTLGEYQCAGGVKTGGVSASLPVTWLFL